MKQPTAILRSPRSLEFSLKFSRVSTAAVLDKSAGSADGNPLPRPESAFWGCETVKQPINNSKHSAWLVHAGGFTNPVKLRNREAPRNTFKIIELRLAFGSVTESVKR